MNLAFSTLGCLEWDLKTLLQNAQQMGFQGIDFRGYQGELDLWKCPPFREHAAETRRRFADAGLSIPCLSSSAAMFVRPEERKNQVLEVQHYLEMAQSLDVPFIRLFGGWFGEAPFETALSSAADSLHRLSLLAQDTNVTLLIETHDSWVNTQMLRTAFEVAQFPQQMGVIWDVHHPYRLAKESPEQTWQNIGPLVRYTHWKDSHLDTLLEPHSSHTSDAPAFHLALPEAGDVPLAPIFSLLQQAHYSGWYTFEWERKWHPELPPAEVAFPQFIQMMHRFKEKYPSHS